MSNLLESNEPPAKPSFSILHLVVLTFSAAAVSAIWNLNPDAENIRRSISFLARVQYGCRFAIDAISFAGLIIVVLAIREKGVNELHPGQVALFICGVIVAGQTMTEWMNWNMPLSAPGHEDGYYWIFRGLRILIVTCSFLAAAWSVTLFPVWWKVTMLLFLLGQGIQVYFFWKRSFAFTGIADQLTSQVTILVWFGSLGVSLMFDAVTKIKRDWIHWMGILLMTLKLIVEPTITYLVGRFEPS